MGRRTSSYLLRYPSLIMYLLVITDNQQTHHKIRSNISNILMSVRILLIIGILNHVVVVFLFEADQVWRLRPVLSVNRLLRSVDDVVIVNAIDSSQYIAGNFFYLDPALEMRRM